MLQMLWVFCSACILHVFCALLVCYTSSQTIANASVHINSAHSHWGAAIARHAYSCGLLAFSQIFQTNFQKGLKAPIL